MSGHLDKTLRPTPTDSIEQWFAVQTQPRKEDWAVANLRNQGFGTFFPRLRKSRKHARRIDTVLVPMFPGYLFVQLKLDGHRWRSVNGTRGVVRLLSFGDQPQPIPVEVVDGLMSSVDDKDVFTFSRYERFRVGDNVRLMVGPFAEQLGRIDRLDGRDRVRVLLELMGRSVPVLASVRDVIPEQRSALSNSRPL